MHFPAENLSYSRRCGTSTGIYGRLARSTIPCNRYTSLPRWGCRRERICLWPTRLLAATVAVGVKNAVLRFSSAFVDGKKDSAQKSSAALLPLVIAHSSRFTHEKLYVNPQRCGLAAEQRRQTRDSLCYAFILISSPFPLIKKRNRI